VGLLGKGQEIDALGRTACIWASAIAGVTVALFTIAKRPACKTANCIVFHCHRAIPNSAIPKISVNKSEKTIAASTAVDPSSQPRFSPFSRIVIFRHWVRIVVCLFSDLPDV
jgi:hypothetical protein